MIFQICSTSFLSPYCSLTWKRCFPGALFSHDMISFGIALLRPVALMPIVSQCRGLLSLRRYFHVEAYVRFPTKEEWPQIWLVLSVFSLVLLAIILLMHC